MTSGENVTGEPLPEPPAHESVVRVWDLPVRLVHWSLVLALPAMWWTAENNAMDWHLRIGVAVLVLVAFRVLWGFFGSSTARFANFVAGPRKVAAYLRGREPHNAPGHNPAGAYSVLALLGLLALQVALGLFSGDPDDGTTGPLNGLVRSSTAATATELHELLFYGLLALVALHVAAILFYRLVRKDDLVTPMITGRRANIDGAGGLTSVPAWKPVACLVTAIALGWWIWSGAPIGRLG